MPKTGAETSTPARRSSGGSKWKEKFEDLSTASRQKLAKIRETEKGRRMIGQVEGIGGAAAAGLLHAYDIEIVIDENLAIPAGLVGGAAGMAVGRMMGSRDVEDVSYGALCGGVALFVSEMA